LFEFVFLGGKIVLAWVIDHLLVKAEHVKCWIGFHHGLHQEFNVGCYVDISTRLKGFLENDVERCFSLVSVIFLLDLIVQAFLGCFW